MAYTMLQALRGDHIERLFLFCLMWSIGGLLEPAGRSAFDTELRSSAPLLPPKACMPFPTSYFLTLADIAMKQATGKHSCGAGCNGGQ